MKVYIGGKITGDPGYREKFRKAAEFLTRAEAERALQETEGKKDGNETNM